MMTEGLMNAVTQEGDQQVHVVGSTPTSKF